MSTIDPDNIGLVLGNVQVTQPTQPREKYTQDVPESIRQQIEEISMESDESNKNHRRLVSALLELPDNVLKQMSHSYVDCEGLAKNREVAEWYANGGEIELKTPIQSWVVGYTPTFNSDYQYRKSRRGTNIKINGFEAPMPLTKIPKKYQTVYLENPLMDELVESIDWEGASCDFRWLRRGLIHETEENALKSAKAKLGMDPNKKPMTIDRKTFETMEVQSFLENNSV